MIQITFNSSPAFLLDDVPLWTDIEVKAAIPVYNDTGKTARESRSPLGDSLRLSQSFSSLVRGYAVNTLRTSLQNLSTEKVLCPLWPAYFAAGTSPVMTASYYALLGDGSAPEIKTHAQLPFSRPAYPLMVGILTEIPNPKLLTGDAQTVKFTFTESDSLFLTPPAFTPPDGLPDLTGSNRPLFPIRPDWTSAPTNRIQREIDRDDIGQRRSKADSFFDNPARLEASRNFMLKGNEPWQLLRFFLTCGGAVKTLWVPSGITEARIVSDISPGDSSLFVDTTDNVGSMSLLVDDLTNRECFRADELDGDRINSSPSFLHGYTARCTRLEAINLVRFKSNTLTLKFSGPKFAESSIIFAEVPSEVSTPAGETTATIGATAVKAYLYEFSIAFPGGSQFFRYTGFERDLTYSGHTFASQPIEHGDIRETASLDRNETTLKARMFTGSPLALLMPFALEWPLMVDIIEVDVSGNTGTNAIRVFRGEVTDAQEIKPPFITATVLPVGPVLERKVLRRIVTIGCNWSLFETRCGILESNFKWQGTVSSFNASTLELAVTGVARASGPAVSLTANYFAGGYLVIGTGTAAQYRMIASNTVPVITSLSLFVAKAFKTAPVAGQTVTFFPGCDGRYETCRDKFANVPNFGGFRWMPIQSPSRAKVVSESSPGGKK